MNFDELKEIKKEVNAILYGYWVGIYDKYDLPHRAYTFNDGQEDEIKEVLKKHQDKKYAEITPQYLCNGVKFNGKSVFIDLENKNDDDEKVSKIANTTSSFNEIVSEFDENIWGIYNNEANGDPENFYDVKEKYQGDYFSESDKLNGMKKVLKDFIPEIEEELKKLKSICYI
jgi:hypothetical protein